MDEHDMCQSTVNMWQSSDMCGNGCVWLAVDSGLRLICSKVSGWIVQSDWCRIGMAVCVLSFMVDWRW